MKRIIVIATLATAGVAFTAMAGTASAADTHRCHMGDPPITASVRTSCRVAYRVLGEYIDTGFAHSRDQRDRTIRFYVRTHPHRLQLLRFVRRGGHPSWGGWVTVTGPNGVWLRFYAGGM